ncbi:MAG: carboxymuconolactone decarboxylase family protein [Bacteroidota bacterium]|nr:carboxymuconolactone decarboxylase family protein [Bacteroidota bacterium]
MKITKLVSISLLLSLFCSPLIAQTTDDDYEKFLSESPFNEMYPRVIAEDAAEYFGEFNMLFSKGPIAPKEARLAAISASAVLRCEYCISAQVHLARKEGATEDEIKAAIQIAAEISRFSTLLYGNDFGLERLNQILGIPGEGVEEVEE